MGCCRLDAFARQSYFRRSDGGRSSMVESQLVELAVAGSSPVGHPILQFQPPDGFQIQPSFCRTSFATLWAEIPLKHAMGSWYEHVAFMQGTHGSSRRCSTRSVCPYGPVRAGFVGPKIPMAGLRNAAATCIGPVSFVTTARHSRITSTICGSEVRPVRS